MERAGLGLCLLRLPGPVGRQEGDKEIPSTPPLAQQPQVRNTEQGGRKRHSLHPAQGYRQLPSGGSQVALSRTHLLLRAGGRRDLAWPSPFPAALHTGLGLRPSLRARLPLRAFSSTRIQYPQLRVFHRQATLGLYHGIR